MRFTDLVNAVEKLLADNERLSFRALRRDFEIDAETLADLIAELTEVRGIAQEVDGTVLVWNGAKHAEPAPRAKPSDYTPSHLAERIRNQRDALETRGAEGERKTITILFADLKGSTAMLEGLDPEVARGIIDPALQLMMDAVHRYEGYVAQALGDGILALFGAPLAHEDHAQRAVFAALKMQEDLKPYALQLRLKQGASLALRVGLNTGEVVVRSIRKDDLHTDYVPVGHSINLAARMEQIATPGSIFLTEQTAKLVEGYFQLKSLGTAEIKGVEQPVPVHEVIGVGQLRTRLQVAASRGLTRFIGRAQELAQMQAALEQARAGRGQVIGIMGEPGMGKSRLVHEFKARASGFAVFEAYSASHGKASPYLPITELLKNYFQIQLQDDERARREKVIGKLLGLDRALEDVLPYYFALLNIDDVDSPLPQLEPVVRRRRTFEAMKKVVLRASLEQPILLIFEDLHWIDSETQGFLDGLVEALGSARVLLLTNYRPEYRQEWGAKSYCTQLRLAPFGRQEAEEFLDVLLGEPADTQTAGRLVGLRQWIMARTEGTPFFTEEVVQELFEQGVLQRDLSGRVTMPQAVTSALQLPATVQGVLAARIDRLTPDEKSLLQQLSVIGREFPFSLAARVVSQAEESLHQRLAALQRKEFLYEQPAFPEVEYLFKHALTQEVAYHSLLQETRKVIHERTAQAIEAAYQTELEDHYGDLAHHFSRSGNVDKGSEYSEKAGTQASLRAANADAVRHFDTALTLLSTQVSSPARDQLEFKIRIALGAQLATVKGISGVETRENYLRAKMLCEVVGTKQQLGAVYIGLRTHFVVAGELLHASDYANKLFQVAQEIADPELTCHAHVALGIQAMCLGFPARSLEHATKALEYYEPTRDKHQTAAYGYDARVGALVAVMKARTVLGNLELSRPSEKDVIATARELGYPFMHTFAMLWTVMVYCLRRDYRACLELADVLILTAREHGFLEWEAWSTVLGGWAKGKLGMPDAATQIMEGIDRAARIPAGIFMPYWYGCLAETYGDQGATQEAAAVLEKAQAAAERNSEHWFDAELCRIAGDLNVADGMPQAVEADFERAIQIAIEQQAKTFELRATLSLAKLLRAQGRSTEAHQRLSNVYEWFTEGFEFPDLQEAKCLLRKLEAKK